MNTKQSRFVKMICLTCCLIFVVGGAKLFSHKQNNKTRSGMYQTNAFAMGTSISVQLYGDVDLEACANACVDEIKRLDEELLSGTVSEAELFQVNQSLQSRQPVDVSKQLYYVLQEAHNISVCTDGALDYTLRPISALWQIEDAMPDTFQVPGESAIQTCLEQVGYLKVDLQETDSKYTVTVSQDGMQLWLGAVGKGYALDAIKQVLDSYRVTGAVVHVGGSVLIYGTKEDDSSWRVGIRNPKGAIDDLIGYLEYPAGTTICVSTSGDYEKYIEKDGVRYHHIFNAKTGYPAESGLSSVTVVCKNGLYSDALSTACFVLGYEKSLPLLEQFQAEAVFINHDNQVTVTDGLKDIYRKN
ncbi:MAG: FAD:protein FMN transferase [Lachnospiraceae bacterium]|nr:FAD:protein FMN transferase [Lachnospiraceae bacterium]